MASYGQVWKEQRKFALMVLRSFGLGERSMEERILEEATHLIQAFTENMSPRGCLGENLARIEIFLFFTSILRNFQLLWPDESRAPDLTPNFGIMMPPSRLKVSLKRRQQNEPS